MILMILHTTPLVPGPGVLRLPAKARLHLVQHHFTNNCPNARDKKKAVSPDGLEEGINLPVFSIKR